MKEIKHEIDFVYISSDGRKFFTKEKAEKYQRRLNKKLSKLHV